MSPTLPHDVWVMIARHLSMNDIHSLLTLNITFYQVGMAAKYGRVTIAGCDYDQVKHYWQHLCEPLVGPHVRRVRLAPWTIFAKPPAHSRFSRLWHEVRLRLDAEYSRRWLRQHKDRTIKVISSAIQGTLTRLNNIYEYSVECSGSEDYRESFVQELLSPSLRTIGASLRTLFLKVPLEALATLPSANNLFALQKLNIHLYAQYPPFLEPQMSHILDALAVFINNLSAMQLFSLTSEIKSLSLNLSRLYMYLGKFPHLDQVSLSIPYDGVQLWPTRPFAAFLIKHSSTLRGLSLTAGERSVRPPRGRSLPPEADLWIYRIIDYLQVDFYLQNIHIALLPLKAPIDPFGRMLEYHTNSLRQLTLDARVLKYPEIQTLLSSPNGMGRGQEFRALESFCLRVEYFTTDLLELLIRQLPALVSLTVDYRYVTAPDPAVSTVSEGSSGGVDNLDAFHKFLRDSTDLQRHWNIGYVSINNTASRNRCTHDAVKDILLECLPIQRILTGFGS